MVSPGVAVVSEEGLGGANDDPDGSTDTTDSLIAGGTIVASDGDGETLSYTLGDPGPVLTSNGAPVTWTGTGTGTLIGSANGGEVIRVTIDASGVYTVTLGDNVDHAGIGIEDIESFIVPVNVSDGTATSATTITVTIEDDSPIAFHDPSVTIEGAGPITGNVLGNDLVGADTPGTVIFLGVNPVGTSTVFVSSYGTLTISSTGSYSYQPNASVPSGSVDNFSYTMRDADGDTAIATLSFSFEGDANLPTAGTTTATVDDEGLTGGLLGGAGDLDANVGDNPLTASEAIFAGTLPRSFGLDGPGVVSLSHMAGTTATIGSELVTYGWNAGSNTLTATITGGARDTAPLFTVQVNPSTGAYTVNLLDNVLHAAGGTENEFDAVLTYRVTDSDSTANPATYATGTLNITFDDDSPSVTALGAQPALVVDETLLASNATASFAGTFTNSFGADGAAAGGGVAYALGINAGATGVFDVATGNQVVLTVEAGQVVGRAGALGPIVFTVSVAANGDVTLDQQRAVEHNNPADPDEPGASAVTLLADNLITLTATATDADGDQASATANIGTNLQFEDDGPSAFAPTAANLSNTAGPVSGPIALSFDPAAGADDVGDVVFNVTNGTPLIDTLGRTLQFGGEELFLQNLAGSNGHVIEARTADGDLAFTATLNPGGDSYTIDLDGPIYNVDQFSFSAVTSTVGGGNTNYKGLGIGTGGTKDILISGTDSVNTNNSDIGIGSGNDLSGTDIARFDMVSNLAVQAVSPANGGTGFTHTGHYEVGTFVQAINFVQGGPANTCGFTVTIRNGDSDFAYLGDGTGETAPPDITVRIYNGDPNAGGTLVSTFTDSDNNVVVTGVRQGYFVQITSSDPFAIVEYSSPTGREFKLGAIQIETANTLDPFSFQLPITGIDGDGDSVNSNITVNLTPFVPPVVLDLDGDGAEFLGLDAGVGFDYNGDGSAESTAWAGADDGLLAIDRNGDGAVNDGSEIVFGGNGLTDLQGLAASYDSNADGELSAADAAFAQFGVWQDANSDGVTQDGEFTSLSDMGITSIDLVSDGIAYSAADGDVEVAGEATYTTANGTTGTVADASFALGGSLRQVARTGELLAASSAAAGLLAAMAIEHANPAASDGIGQATLAVETNGQAAAIEPTTRMSLDAGLDMAMPAAKQFADGPAPSGRSGDQSELAADRAELGQSADRQDQAATGNDGAKSALFDFSDNAAMDALLSHGAAGTAKGAEMAAHPAIVAALEDSTGAEAVDSIVDHFAGTDSAMPEQLGMSASFGFESLLQLGVSGGGADLAGVQFGMMQMIDHEQADAMA